MDHPVDVQAHLAIAGARATVGAPLGIGLQAQCGSAHQVADLPAQDHKGGHPADVVAAGPPAKQPGQPQEQDDDDVKDDVPIWLVQRQATIQHVEGVHRPVAPGRNGQCGDDANPRDPDGPFDPVELAAAGGLAVHGRTELLQSARRAQPAAPEPAGEQGREEQQSKHDETGVDDALRGTGHDDIGRHVVQGDGEQQQRNK